MGTGAPKLENLVNCICFFLAVFQQFLTIHWFQYIPIKLKFGMDGYTMSSLFHTPIYGWWLVSMAILPVYSSSAKLTVSSLETRRCQCTCLILALRPRVLNWFFAALLHANHVFLCLQHGEDANVLCRHISSLKSTECHKPVWLQVACMQFINIIVHSVEDVNFRVHLQHEFSLLGLDDYLVVCFCLHTLHKHLFIIVVLSISGAFVCTGRD